MIAQVKNPTSPHTIKWQIMLLILFASFFGFTLSGGGVLVVLAVITLWHRRFAPVPAAIASK